MKKKNYFNYIVILAVLIIPFMYSFFYLKAYWNPYGEGNIDNLPVAIINSDKGEKGSDLVQSILDSKKLKISVVDEEEATDGLNNGDYYAVINIPENFTSDLESAKEENKSHATITYSPNQKSNYLASQIINNVVSVVEKNLDNEVNSTIIENLEETVTSIPEQLETISDGFGDLADGTKKLNDGSATLSDGTTTLNNSYTEFHNGVSTLNDGLNTLNESVKEFDTLNKSVDQLIDGVTELKKGSDNFTSSLDQYVAGVNKTLDYTDQMVEIILNKICPNATTLEEKTLCGIANGINEKNINNNKLGTIAYLKANATLLQNGNKTINNGLSTLTTKINAFSGVKTKIVDLQKGVEKLKDGANTLYVSSGQVKDGISTLNSGATTLQNGINTLYKSVVSAKNELDDKIDTTKNDVKKVEGLASYSKEPVVVNTTPVNEVSSYGTAFSPFFISIALWVGCLMMFIVLYYDKNERFGIFGINYSNKVKRSFAYHGLVTVASILLGIMLQAFLDFEITNIFTYYLSLILIGNTFMAIMNFLIINLNDIGKFIGLILLVLQLAAAGGTFPIETVTKGFRWLHPILPMTYTNKLLKESLMTFESNLFTKNILIILGICLVFMIINLLLDIYRNKKVEK